MWPWLLALVAAIAVVWIWAAAGDDEGRPGEETATLAEPAREGGAVGTTGGAVGEYLEFVRTSGSEAERGAMGRDHEYTAEGIRHLGAALNDLVQRDGDADSRERYDRFRQVADRIQQDPTSAQHANQVRDAFTRAAEVIQSLDGVQGGERLQPIAESIDPQQPLLDQREKVHSFFRESAEALRAAG